MDRAVAETTEQLENEAKKNEELLKKEFEGEKDVLQTKIDFHEKLVAEQQKHIDTLSKQMDTVYGKVQEIALKAVSGKSLEDLQPFISQHREQTEGGHKG